MALPNTGSLSMTQLATEFSDSAPHSLSEFYRGGGKVPDTPGNAAVPASGQVAIGNFYGTQNRSAITLTISAQTTNYNLYSTASADPGYIAGSTDITLNINPGVNVGSNSTGSYSLSVPSQFNPADVVIINNQGTVIGAGGGGGAGGYGQSQPGQPVNPGSSGGGGGGAVQISRPVTINNVGTLAGGGGGGGGGGAGGWTPNASVGRAGGGGGGGGAGYNAGGGGPRGQPFFPGSGQGESNNGSSGSINSGGGGGSGTIYQSTYGGSGGSGGGRGASGSSGGQGFYAGSAATNGGGGGSAGQYLNGSPYVTWQSTGTRQGGVS